jgi:acyl-homoserine lactone acylase PvdQ
MWQLERTRRMVYSRMSEMFGTETLALDEFSYSLAYIETAKKTWDYLHETGD